MMDYKGMMKDGKSMDLKKDKTENNEEGNHDSHH